jgi:short-subunit dehydrogenase involved in D-alanine esterification of teichoic acids
MKTRGNIILIAGGKFGGGRGFAEAFHPFGLRETLYFVWGDIR